ncbi:MAG: MBL fold metallo-hydrolase [Bacteroidales bacterium]|nr:MBL fold metallo-hydrolase [Bacteroidales bacterium]
MMKLSIFETGFFKSDGGAMFGLLPKEIWKKYYFSDNKNLCRMSMRCVLIETGKRKIIVDPGLGMKSESVVPGYGFSDLKDISKELQKINVSNDQITDIVLTHLHFDHSEAITRHDEGGDLSLCFPNADYYIGKKQWDRCFNCGIIDNDAYFTENISVLNKNRNLHLVENDFFLEDNIKIELFDGHTPGQIVVYLNGKSDGLENIVIPGDVVPTNVNIRTEAISGFDLNGEVSAKEKLRLLEKVYETDSRMIFYHDYFIESCKVGKNKNRFYAKERIESVNFEVEK